MLKLNQLTFAIAAILLLSSCSNSTNNSTASSVAEQNDTMEQSIKSPLPILEQQAEELSILASKGGTLQFEGGTQVFIPAGAFLCDGKPVNDSVQIKLTQYRNTFDIFASGIPMQYDSAGRSFTFASAGMCRIEGQRKGKQLTICQGKTLSVKMFSAQKGTNYSLYYYDTIRKAWQNKGKDKVLEAPKINQKNIEAQLKAFETEANSSQPRLVENKDLLIPIEIEDAERFPEFVVYDSVSFQVSSDKSAQIEKLLQQSWYEMSISTAKDKKSFRLILEGNQGNVSIEGMPIMDGKPYPEAIKDFAAKQKRYNERIRIRDSLANLFKYQRIADSLSFEVTRQFAIAEFGIWNCDAPLLAQGLPVTVTPLTANNDTLNFRRFSVAYENMNAVYNPYEYNSSVLNFKLLPTKHVIYGVTLDQKLYFTVINENDVTLLASRTQFSLRFRQANNLSSIYRELRQFVDSQITAMSDEKTAWQ